MLEEGRFVENYEYENFERIRKKLGMILQNFSLIGGVGGEETTIHCFTSPFDSQFVAR